MCMMKSKKVMYDGIQILTLVIKVIDTSHSTLCAHKSDVVYTHIHPGPHDENPYIICTFKFLTFPVYSNFKIP